jgi:hypothetical protein
MSILNKLVGKRARVYFNLHKNRLSVQYKGLVVAHVDEIKLENAQFKVSEAGRERVLREKRKNVHAFVVGVVSNNEYFVDTEITYNPYKYSSFVNRETGKPIHEAAYVRIVGRSISAQT